MPCDALLYARATIKAESFPELLKHEVLRNALRQFIEQTTTQRPVLVQVNGNYSVTFRAGALYFYFTADGLQVQGDRGFNRSFLDDLAQRVGVMADQLVMTFMKEQVAQAIKSLSVGEVTDVTNQRGYRSITVEL